MEAYIIIGILKFWSVAWVVSIMLMVFRADSTAMFSEVFSVLAQPNLFSILVSVVLIYIMLPLTIPYSIANIIKSNQ